MHDDDVFEQLLTHSVHVEYRVLRHLGEGTFSEVLKAESVKTRQKVAIKCMKSHFDKIEQVSLCLALAAIGIGEVNAESGFVQSLSS